MSLVESLEESPYVKNFRSMCNTLGGELKRLSDHVYACIIKKPYGTRIELESAYNPEPEEKLEGYSMFLRVFGRKGEYDFVDFYVEKFFIKGGSCVITHDSIQCEFDNISYLLWNDKTYTLEIRTLESVKG